jgi:hypothetical protein
VSINLGAHHTSASAEFKAIETIHKTLDPLDDEARSRVINYIISLLGVSTKAQPTHKPDSKSEKDTILNQSGGESAPSNFGTFAELHDAVSPGSNADRACVAGYWLQVCQAADGFDSQSANKELKNLGHGIINITDALNNLKDRKPAEVLQLQKSGTSKQARKKYKLTVAGIRKIEGMING